MKTLNISKFSAYGFIGILIFLHVINTNIDPTWQPISMYALGNMGWMMNLAFFLLGLSFLTLGVYIYQSFKALGAKISGILLVLAAFGNFLAGVFNTDPVDTLPEQMTTSGSIHAGAAGLLGFMVLATLLVCYQFFKQEKLRPYRYKALVATIIVWIAEVAMISAMSMYLSETNGMLTPGTPVGGIGRIVILCCTLWVLLTASLFIKAMEFQIAGLREERKGTLQNSELIRNS